MKRKVKEACAILEQLGLPPSQQNEMSALTLLALGDVGPRDAWQDAKRTSLTVSKGIMAFVESRYGKTYAPNTRETFRRQVLHQFVQAGVAEYNPDDPSLPTNSPRAHYAISEAALVAIRQWGTPVWHVARDKFLGRHGSLATLYRTQRKMAMVPVTLESGEKVELSPGKHNEVQAAIIREFAPRFAPGARLYYLGDTASKTLVVDADGLRGLGLVVTEHGKLPDVVLYEPRRNWLFLVEAVTSHGPMSPKRVTELRHIVKDCKAGIVFVSAFPDFAEFRKHLRDVAWETEVWIAEIPDHLIHYNGDRFLGPRESPRDE